jgi:sterol desaturase/sphingolipid hydroxylase (fatty acid hydroxylase superfamily)
VDWLTNTRAHPIDMMLVRLGGLVPVYLLGLASATGGGLDPVTLWVSIIGTVWSFAIHANVRWRFGPLEWLVATPAFHHWHHTNCEKRDRNFSAVFPVVDRVFGTAYLPQHLPSVYGIDGHVAPGFTGQLIDPLLGPVRPKAQPAE